MTFLFLTTLGDVATYALYILIAVLVLLVMITVHEAGHYFAGKIFGFGIEEFSIGFGPKIFSKTKKDGEKFSVRAIPLGGYCAFTGEDGDSTDAKAFNNKKPWQRIIVLVAGAFMNYLTAIILISLMFGIYGQSAVYVHDVAADSPKTEYVLNEKDVIIGANGKNVYLVTDLMNAISGKKAGDEVTFNLFRQGEFKDVTVKLLADADFKNLEDVETLCKALGVLYETGEDGATHFGFYTTGVKLGFFKTVGHSFSYSLKLAGTVFTVFRQLFTGMLGINSLGGTVTTITVTASAIQTGGLWSLLNIAGFIGVNLAVFNLIPFPALDGSRVVFTAIEWARGKPISRRVEGVIHTVGFVLILLFAIIVDLQRCF